MIFPLIMNIFTSIFSVTLGFPFNPDIKTERHKICKNCKKITFNLISKYDSVRHMQFACGQQPSMYSYISPSFLYAHGTSRRRRFTACLTRILKYLYIQFYMYSSRRSSIHFRQSQSSFVRILACL